MGHRFDDVIAWNEIYSSKWWEIKMWCVAWEKHRTVHCMKKRGWDSVILNHQHGWRQWRTKKIQSHVLILFDSANHSHSMCTISFNSKTLPAQPWHHPASRWASERICVCVWVWPLVWYYSMRAHFMWCSSFQPVEQFIQQVLFSSVPASACVVIGNTAFTTWNLKSNRVGSIKGVAFIN